MDDYRFGKDEKDPVIDMMRTVVETYATMEGVSFNKALWMIQDGTREYLKAGTLRNWFYGSTKWPQYRHVARLYLFLQRYVRRPITIGARKAYPIGAVRRSA